MFLDAEKSKQNALSRFTRIDSSNRGYDNVNNLPSPSKFAGNLEGAIKNQLQRSKGIF